MSSPYQEERTFRNKNCIKKSPDAWARRKIMKIIKFPLSKIAWVALIISTRVLEGTWSVSLEILARNPPEDLKVDLQAQLNPSLRLFPSQFQFKFMKIFFRWKFLNVNSSKHFSNQVKNFFATYTAEKSVSFWGKNIQIEIFLRRNFNIFI